MEMTPTAIESRMELQQLDGKRMEDWVVVRRCGHHSLCK